MANKYELNNKLLIKMALLVSVFLIIFLLGTNKVYASFKYSDFDYDEFAEQTKDYWTTYCPSGDQECIDQIIKTQRKFYTKLYNLLARYEARNLIIDDTIIIATVFYEYTPSGFNDTSGSYKMDNDDGKNYNVDVDEDKEFFEQEIDTLKLLLKAMIGYERTCYGVSNPRTETETIKTEDGEEKIETHYVCDDGNLTETGNGYKCYSSLKKESVSFWRKYADAFGSFFGIKSDSQKECEQLASSSGYGESKVTTDGKKQVLEYGYWEFLEKGRYFDNKANLYHRYLGLLQKANTKDISELYDNEEYEKELIKVRQRIIADIKEIIDKYRKYRPESAYNDSSRNDFWWPIGSAETEEKDGKVFASGDPISTTITSSFGPRVDPVDKSVTKNHHGIDIGNLGGNGNAYVIAAKAGTVTSINTNCVSGGDETCGSGYGNYVLIQHSNGLYTFYAHLHENSIRVEEGESVGQGQVLATAGSSGKSTGTHLHFEVRVGPTSSNAVDPLEYINPDNPRPKPGTLTHVDGGTVMQEICLSLKASGFSNTGIAAVLVNINAESGFNPNIIGDGGTSYGLCQWHNDRWDNLRNFTSEWETVSGQLQFLIHELETGYMGLYNSLLNGYGSATDLANQYCVQFERPANTETTCENRASSTSTEMYNYVNNNCN